MAERTGLQRLGGDQAVVKYHVCRQLRDSGEAKIAAAPDAAQAETLSRNGIGMPRTAQGVDFAKLRQARRQAEPDGTGAQYQELHADAVTRSNSQILLSVNCGGS